MSTSNTLLNILPWIGIIALLVLVVVVDWRKIWISIVRLVLAILFVLAGIGYFVTSRLADFLPRWFPGQGVLSTIAFWLGLFALAGLIAAIDWSKMWRKYKWQMICGVELTLLIFLYTSGLFALVPGASAVDTEIQNWIHLKPWAIEIVSAGPSPEAAPHAGAEFLAIQTKITNSGNEAATIIGVFELYDLRGRRFTPYILSWFSAIDSMNPGISRQSALTFEVPSTRGLWFLTMYPSPLHRMGGVTVAFLVL